MFIDELIKISPSGRINLLKRLIELNKYSNLRKIRLKHRRNANVVKSDLANFLELGLIQKRKFISEVGQYKAKVKFDNYRINNNHPVIKLLKRKINEM